MQIFLMRCQCEGHVQGSVSLCRDPRAPGSVPYKGHPPRLAIHLLPSSPSHRGPSPPLRSPTGFVPATSRTLWTLRGHQPTRTVMRWVGPCQLLHPLFFLSEDSRKFALDLTCFSTEKTAPLLHPNLTGCLPWALIFR